MKKFIKIGILCLIIGIILEVCLFNFRTWQSISYKSIDLTNKIEFHGIKKEKSYYVVEDNNDNYIEIKNINKNTKNIKLDFQTIGNHSYLNYSMFEKDDANSYYLEMPDRFLYSDIEKSKYVKLNLSGKTKSIKIKFNNDVYKEEADQVIAFKINNISINCKVPIDISYTRFLLVSFLIFILYCIRPKSEFYKYKLNLKNKYQIGIVVSCFVLIAMLFFYLVHINDLGVHTIMTNHTQYYDLTRALAKGQVYLDTKVDSNLKKMKNPYDNLAREKKNVVFWWDRAYYKGKYYVYFGVVPVITSYLPYYFLFGNMLPNYILTYIVSLLSVLGIFLLLKEIAKKYFKNISFLLFLIMFLWMCGGFVPILLYPGIYNIPVVYGLMFIYFGLYFFMSSIKENRISCLRIFLGSLCMALVTGCRPQMLLSSFLAIPIFWDSIKKRDLFSKKSIKQTILSIIPYVVVALFIMFYNKIRFGSIVDFGAGYNLTGSDMTKKVFDFDRLGLGLFYMLFSPLNIKAIYPFLYGTDVVTNYMGVTTSEVNFGGLLVTNLVLFLGIFFYKFKKYIPKKLFNINIGLIIIAFIILIFDIEFSGILTRYFSDFSWALEIATVIVVFGLFNSKLSKNIKRVIWSFILITVILYFGYLFLTVLDDSFFHNMININTPYYFKWYYLLQWWL